MAMCDLKCRVTQYVKLIAAVKRKDSKRDRQFAGVC